VVNVTKQNILDADVITHAELIELLDKQEKNNATTEEKYQIERYMYKKEWGIKLLDEKQSWPSVSVVLIFCTTI
jgi:hypothetical protein